MLQDVLKLLLTGNPSQGTREAARTFSGAPTGLKTAPGRLERLLSHVLESPRGRAVVASSRELPPAALALLAADEDDTVRLAVAGNPATPPEVLVELADDWVCRLAVAGNSGAPPALLTRLAVAWDPAVRKAVARNPAAPSEVLEVLAEDADLGVRTGVARNSNAPSGALRLLVDEGVTRIRRALADNPNCPAEVLVRLNEGDDPVVQRLLIRHAGLASLQILSAQAQRKTGREQEGVSRRDVAGPHRQPLRLRLEARP
jgi:hypothetical protein